MKTLFALVLLVFVGIVAWRIGGYLSSDAIGMGVGMLLGIMAGIPTALILLAGTRGRCDCDCHRRPQQHHQPQRPQIVEQNYYVHMDAPRAAELPQTYRRELNG